jgi:hypothetical protein
MNNKHRLVSTLMTSTLVALIIALTSADAGFAQQFSSDLFSLSIGAASVRFEADAYVPLPACRRSQTCSTWLR